VLIARHGRGRGCDICTKIIGGRRIDLFGARVEQLPAIWWRLVDAGFESGHAYGKALRTVKSCVGNTWCRYGVQDSVGIAVALELRHRGLRAPHKIKAAVSGRQARLSSARGLIRSTGARPSARSTREPGPCRRALNSTRRTQRRRASRDN
jgi:nitrite reductase (NADH) large subunit